MVRPAHGSAWRGEAAVVASFVGVIAAYREVIPYWDAKSYFDCITLATQQPFSLLNFRCVGHPSILYLFVLGLTQYIARWSVWPMYAINALLGAASIVAFHRLLGLLFPQRPDGEYAVVTALYAFAPLFVVHAVFLNIDFPMTALFVVFLYFVLAGRYWSASVAAVATMFTKEIGAAAYAVTVVAYVVAFTLRAQAPWGDRLARLRAQWPLAVPAVAVAMFVAVSRWRDGSSSWLGAYLPVAVILDRVDFYLNTNLADPGIRAYLADMFILNWQWVYALVVVAAGCAAFLRPPASRDTRVATEGTAAFLVLVTAGLAYAVTRYRVYNNARYVLIVAPVLVLAFYHALLSLRASRPVRLVVVCVMAAFVLVSNFRTIDPVSKRVFGTFPFGSHALLDLPSFVGGPRLDSIVYNFESLQFHYLLTDVMLDLRPTYRTVLFMGDTTYNFPPHVDGRSYKLTLDPSHAIPLSILAGDGDVMPEALRSHNLREGDRFFYMAFANADNHQLRLLRDRYPVVATKQYDRSGYTLDVFTFEFTSGP
jgi:hypothetical protein